MKKEPETIEEAYKLGMKKSAGLLLAEKLIDKLQRSTFPEVPGHEFIDTCDIYIAFQKARKALDDL